MSYSLAAAGAGMSDDELAQLVEAHRADEHAFARSETRRTRLKRGPLDCGHVIDGSEPYRYHVWKVRGTAGVEQRRECEFCARRELAG